MEFLQELFEGTGINPADVYKKQPIFSETQIMATLPPKDLKAAIHALILIHKSHENGQFETRKGSAIAGELIVERIWKATKEDVVKAIRELY